MAMANRNLSARMAFRLFSSTGSGKMLSEEEKAAENVYIKALFPAPTRLLPSRYVFVCCFIFFLPAEENLAVSFMDKMCEFSKM